MYYHALEKGMSNRNLRLNFGQYPLDKLLETLSIYVTLGYDLKNTRFLSGLDVVNKYIIIHKDKNIDLIDIKNRYNTLLENIETNNKSYGGIINYSKANLLSNNEKSFSSLVNKRHSVRVFSEREIDNEKLATALSLSQKTPSACNRQPWKTYVIKNKKIITDSLNIQKGLKGLGDNIQRLIIITSSNSMYGAAKERNAAYIDGGLYGMTLLYALTDVGLATCTLNLALNITDSKKMRKLLNISNDEVFIMAIAVGNYPDSYNVPQSERDEVNESVVWI